MFGNRKNNTVWSLWRITDKIMPLYIVWSYVTSSWSSRQQRSAPLRSPFEWISSVLSLYLRPATLEAACWREDRQEAVLSSCTAAGQQSTVLIFKLLWMQFFRKNIPACMFDWTTWKYTGTVWLFIFLGLGDRTRPVFVVVCLTFRAMVVFWSLDLEFRVRNWNSKLFWVTFWIQICTPNLTSNLIFIFFFHFELHRDLPTRSMLKHKKYILWNEISIWRRNLNSDKLLNSEFNFQFKFTPEFALKMKCQFEVETEKW